MIRRSRSYIEDDKKHDRWLVSYSDFLTLLFALFVVLFTSTYYKGHSSTGLSRDIPSVVHDVSPLAAAESPQKATRGVHGSSIPVPPHIYPATHYGSAIPLAELALLQRQLEAAIEPELRNHDVVVRATPEGIVISLRDFGFFDVGNATLLPGTDARLKRIALVLSQHDLHLRIEGHSDNQPIHNDQYRSNWELSTARAVTVLSLFLNESSFDPAKLSIAGYGEYRPVASNDTVQGRRLNRRVDLVVVAEHR